MAVLLSIPLYYLEVLVQSTGVSYLSPENEQLTVLVLASVYAAEVLLGLPLLGRFLARRRQGYVVRILIIQTGAVFGLFLGLASGSTQYPVAFGAATLVFLLRNPPPLN